MDACIHTAILNAIISASKVFQVPATSTLKQKLYGHICRQTECNYWMQTYCCHKVLEAASFHTSKVFQEDNMTKVSNQLKSRNTRSCIQFCV